MPEEINPTDDELIAELRTNDHTPMPTTSTTTRNLTATLILALTACASPTTNTTVLHQFPPKAADSPVAIFRLETPQCDFREIGIATARRPNKFTPVKKATDALRIEARKMGGDALVGVYEISPIRNPSAFFLNRDPVISGVVIRFTDPGCAR